MRSRTGFFLYNIVEPELSDCNNAPQVREKVANIDIA